MMTEQEIAQALEGKFFLVDGTDKNEDARLAAAFRTSERAARIDKRRQQMVREAARQKLTRERVKAGHVTPAIVVAAVAYAHGVPVEDICSSSREQPVVAARKHAYTVMRRRLKKSLPAIGRYMGRDHATVSHGISSWDVHSTRYATEVEVVLDLLGFRDEVAA
jgi:chromosomal replication initiation ATPase DnaA